jgi:Na+/phosphate symporter
VFDFVQSNAIVLFCAMAAAILLLIALWIAWAVKQNNKQREKEFNNNRDAEMLRVRISELEKEVAQMHEHEAQMLAERDSILMAAHEKADDILEQTMQRVQKSESQIRQNRIIASCCITDARRRISDLLIEVSKRLVIEDGNVLDAEQITPEAVEDAEREEKVAEANFTRLVDNPTADQTQDNGASVDNQAETQAPTDQDSPVQDEESTEHNDVPSEEPAQSDNQSENV